MIARQKKIFAHLGLGLLGNLNLRSHSLAVEVAGPLHHHLRRDAAGEGEANEGAA